MNLRTTQFHHALQTAQATVEAGGKPHAIDNLAMSAFNDAKFDPEDYADWRAHFNRFHGELGILALQKTASELEAAKAAAAAATPAPAPAKK